MLGLIPFDQRYAVVRSTASHGDPTGRQMDPLARYPLYPNPVVSYPWPTDADLSRVFQYTPVASGWIVGQQNGSSGSFSGPGFGQIGGPSIWLQAITTLAIVTIAGLAIYDRVKKKQR